MKKKHRKYRKYHEINKFLKSILPLDLPVHVRRVPLPSDCDGDCDREKKRYLIRSDKSLPPHLAVEIAIHEWAHVLAWHKEKIDHDKNWGMAYAYIYRLVIPEFFEKPG